MPKYEVTIDIVSRYTQYFEIEAESEEEAEIEEPYAILLEEKNV